MALLFFITLYLGSTVSHLLLWLIFFVWARIHGGSWVYDTKGSYISLLVLSQFSCFAVASFGTAIISSIH